MQKYEGRPFVLLGVDQDNDRDDLQRTQKKYDLNWRSWWDEGGSIASRWNVSGLPSFFLIDHKGIVRWSSEESLNLKQMEAVLERLVKEAESEGRKQASLNRDR